MKKPVSVSKEEAIRLNLQSQGIGNSFGKNKTGALKAIRHLGYVQLDTLAVVARAHHHTLWNRVGNYKQHILNELVLEKKIFEYWSHAAAFLPMEDYRFSLVRKNEFLQGKKHWFAKDKKIHKYVLDKIKAEGPLQSKDFETDKRRGSWFDWKPAKIALEQLFQDGSLMVAGRKGFQKVYDLTERILPPGINTSLPSQEEFAEYLVRTTIRAHGFASVKDMTHLRKGMRSPVEKLIKKMILAGEILPAYIENTREAYYRLPNYQLPIGNHAKASILSPFDNAVIRRERVKDLFDYDFFLECYLPDHKRKFGYFCLPVLYQNKFVAKFDPKADRASGIFYVKSFYLENKPGDMSEFISSFADELKLFAAFNDCDKIVIEKSFPSKLKPLLKRNIES